MRVWVCLVSCIALSVNILSQRRVSRQCNAVHIIQHLVPRAYPRTGVGHARRWHRVDTDSEEWHSSWSGPAVHPQGRGQDNRAQSGHTDLAVDITLLSHYIVGRLMVLLAVAGLCLYVYSHVCLNCAKEVHAGLRFACTQTCCTSTTVALPLWWPIGYELWT